MAKITPIENDMQFFLHPKFELYKSIVNGLIFHQGTNFFFADAIRLTDIAWEEWIKHNQIMEEDGYISSGKRNF